MFNKLASRANKILKRGDLCAIEGSLSYYSYTNTEQQSVNRTDVVARDFTYLGNVSAKERKPVEETA